jgi:hypothetical protein
MFSNPFFDDRADAGEKLAEAVLGELGKLNLTAQEAVKPIVYGVCPLLCRLRAAWAVLWMWLSLRKLLAQII